MDDNPFDDLVMNERAPLLVENDANPQIENIHVDRNPYRDPFTAEMERFARAGQTAGGESDEFYQFIEAQRSRIKDLNEASRQLGNPPSAVGKRLGGNASLNPDVNIVQAPGFRWQADDDGENTSCTITLGLVNPLGVESGAASALRPFAYVRWGTYGFLAQAEVDIGRGVQLTVNASDVEVILALDGSQYDAANPVNMFAFLGFKRIVNQAPIIRTRYIDSQAQNSATNVVVPPFANFLLPIQMSDRNGSVQLDLTDSKNVIVGSLAIANGTQVAPIPLTSDIVRIVVTTTTANTQYVRLPFQLSF